MFAQMSVGAARMSVRVGLPDVIQRSALPRTCRLTLGGGTLLGERDGRRQSRSNLGGEEGVQGYLAHKKHVIAVDFVSANALLTTELWPEAGGLLLFFITLKPRVE